MRISVTCPDGLGDFLFRLPFLLKAEECGHTLQICAQLAVLEAAVLAGLQAQRVALRENPYGKTARRKKHPFDAEIRAIEQFRPDVVFLAPFQPSFLEETVAGRLRNLKLYGFESTDENWLSESVSDPRDIAKLYSHRIPVARSLHESEKLEAAWRAIFGESRTLPPLSLAPPPAVVAAARNRLAGWGLQEREFITCCAGYRRGDYFQGWGEENWGAALAEVGRDRRICFVGSSGEADTAAEIFEKAGGRKAGHVFAVGQVGSIGDLTALLSLSCAYVGKDTGTLHLAAALGLPVLGVFGGGHWARFVPRNATGFAITVAMPCQGCDWRCHLQEPFCVTGLRPEDVVAAWRRLPEMRGFETLEIPPSAAVREEVFQTSHLKYPPLAHTLKRLRISSEPKDGISSRLRSFFGKRN